MKDIKGMNKATFEDYRSQLTAWMTEITTHLAASGKYITSLDVSLLKAKVETWKIELDKVIDRMDWFLAEERKVQEASNKAKAEAFTADLMKKFKIVSEKK